MMAGRGSHALTHVGAWFSSTQGVTSLEVSVEALLGVGAPEEEEDPLDPLGAPAAPEYPVEPEPPPE